MSDMKIGINDIKKICIGNNEASKVYIGTKVLYQKQGGSIEPPVPVPPPIDGILLNDDDIVMTPKHPSVSNVEKRGNMSRYISTREHSDGNMTFKIFNKVLPAGRYKFECSITERKGTVYGYSSFEDEYAFQAIDINSDGINPSACFVGMKKNSGCLVNNLKLTKIGEAVKPRPPFVKPSTKNVIETYVNKEDGKTKTIIWAAGIKNPPKMGGDKPDFNKLIVDGNVIYDTAYTNNGEWYDANKDPVLIGDNSLCFVAAAVNSLQWWINANRHYIERFLEKGGKIPKDPHGVKLKILKSVLADKHPIQDKSPLWQYVAGIFMGRTDGGYTDCVIDQFLNGYWIDDPVNIRDWVVNSEAKQGKRILDEGVDPKGGFFNEVLGIRRLTERRAYNGNNLAEYTKQVKDAFLNGGMVCPSFFMPLYGDSGHIVTAWGAEFDEDGSLSALFISDSDDDPSPDVGMDRRMIGTNTSGQITLTTRIDRKGGATVMELNTIFQGKEFWEEYFKNKK